MTPNYDLVITGGLIIDPAQDFNGPGESRDQ